MLKLKYHGFENHYIKNHQTTDKDNKEGHKTILKWEKDFETKFDFDLSGKDVIRLRCTLCTKWEKHICSIINSSYNYIRPRTTSIKRIALNRTVCRCHTKELPISN